MDTKIAQISHGYFKPDHHMQINLWQIGTHVRKEYKKT
jgi:hypothetical protein